MNHLWLLCGWLAAFLAGANAACPAQALRFEAEDCVVNTEVVLKDKAAPHGWMLWSTDRDAQRKWSGGVVLKSPPVAADRATPEDGAAPLHLKLKNIPAGTYDLRVRRSRALAVSLDGKQWTRMVDDIAAHDLKITGGTLDFWVDDRFAEAKPEHRGSSYIDWVALERAAPLVHGVWNGDFELVDEGRPLAWALPAATDNVTAAVVAGPAHGGQHALRIAITPGENDRCLCGCTRSFGVKPGAWLCLSAWVKGTVEGTAAFGVDGLAAGQLVKRQVGHAVLEDAAQWTRFAGYFQIPEGVTELRLALRATGAADFLVDDVTLVPAAAPRHQGTRVRGWATTRVCEKLDRGVVALRCKQGAYISWRLLDSDPPHVGFLVSRSVNGAQPVPLHSQPITKTCDLVDRDPPQQGTVVYRVEPQGGVLPAGEASLSAEVEETPHLKLRLREPDLVANRVALGDLDGDGAMDFVVKHPNQSIDPANSYWRRSTATYKLDAYTSRGAFLWRRDLGWSIETGVWYAPYLVADLDGDGRAEVVAKTGEGDPRDAEGRVRIGPEWLTVIDGRTGRDVCRTAWPSRRGFGSYNLASRNQLAVAYLDGRTPCVLALRGTYSRMKVDAYQLVDHKLQRLWSYDNAAYPPSYWGQGAHTTRVADVDGDGRDEVLLGSACLDDDGTALWTTGRGHPDGAHLGDLLPSLPGLEVFYCLETAQQVDGGLCMVEAATGKTIWALGGPTRHVHSGGMASDLDPTVPGCEGYGADTDENKRTNRGWLFTADGTLLATGARYGTACPTVFWDADLQREVFRRRVFKHHGGPLEGQPTTGKVADILGDWREEIISAAPGELRIYSTTLPAMDRRVCLLQDRIYRACVCMSSMGYETPPTVAVTPAAVAVNLNLTFVPDRPTPVCRVVVSAGPQAGLKGELTLRAEGPFTLAAERLKLDLKAGGIFTKDVPLVDTPAGKALVGRIVGELKTGGDVLRGETWVELAKPGSAPLALVEAETFSAQGGGRVQRRALADGCAIGQWTQKGHFLEWSVDLPAGGRWEMLARYHAQAKVTRRLLIDGSEVRSIAFPATRGQGDRREDWDEVTFVAADGKPFQLERGHHTIRLENTDGADLDLDYLGFSRGW
jgi:rhamnogalacturonan endolyase